MNKINGKIIFEGRIKVVTGMHIGGPSEFAAIGSVDNIVIKDPLTKLPIIPGSSLKGKMRYLLSRYQSDTDFVKKIDDENEEAKRLFGCSSKETLTIARLQFFDLFMNKNSVEKLQNADTDLYVTEIKFENTISRLTGIANPRQQERVPAGAEFDFKLVYNIEDINEMKEDMANLQECMELLELDYLGGHGTRGYGRVRFDDLEWSVKFASDDVKNEAEQVLCDVFRG